MTERIAIRPAGFFGIGLFFCFGSFMAAYAAFTLAYPGTLLDRLWDLNRPAHVGLTALGPIMVVPFAILSTALLLAGLGWFRRQYWGWLLGLAIIATNLVADFIHALLGDWLKSGVGVLIAGALFFYLTRPVVRAYFLLETKRNSP